MKQIQIIDLSIGDDQEIKIFQKFLFLGLAQYVVFELSRQSDLVNWIIERMVNVFQGNLLLV